MPTICNPTTTRLATSPSATDVYFTASPADGADPKQQAHDLYLRLRETLDATDAAIFSERIFASPDCMDDVLHVREQHLAHRSDGVPPICLEVPATSQGSVAGIQVYAVCAGHAMPRPLRCWNHEQLPIGRVFDLGGERWVFASGRSAPQGEAGPGAQARRTFQCLRCLLEQTGGSMQSVARTWLWLDGVLDWYSQLNAARTDFFREQGLIDAVHNKTRLPASTGIGVHGRHAGPCMLDMIAMPGQESRIRTLEAGGHQNSAYRYGSAFSRACEAPMPGGKTIFISGTAAIDTAGRTEHVNDIDGQIDATLDHVRALLRDVSCADEQVVTALVYCKTQRVLDAFRRKHPALPWPHVAMIADVCRDDLLFEVELTAAVDAAC